jgi:ATP-dependent DNA helicase DinG
MTPETQSQPEIMNYFVLAEPRTKQITAVDYIDRKYKEGFRHIVIAAPTGVGKSAIGATACFWSRSLNLEGQEGEDFDPGGYYLVTQKLLQEQLKRDFKDYTVEEPTIRCQSIKSATDYPCLQHGNCAVGMSRKVKCSRVKEGNCSYAMQKRAWVRATMSVTNYPYLFTEHWMVGNLPPRKVLVLDECHTLEKQVLKFVEVTLTQETLERWTPTIKRVPEFDNVEDFANFLLTGYLPILWKRLEALSLWEPTDDSAKDRKMEQDKMDLENHYTRTLRGARLIQDDPDNWVFWQEENKDKQMEAMAKPLDAAPFAHDLIFEMGHVCIHMSAYPGSKKIYCQSLGLNPDEVAWLNLNSTFPVKNREIYMTLIGSMSRRNREQTMPDLLEFTQKIMESYDTKGIIHCNSYELGRQIYQALRGTPQGHRLLFPQNSDDREPVFQKHKQANYGTVILSPSMTEGFDFAYDLARWQVIAKVPYPYLGDRQVAAKKDRNPDWYDLQAVMSIIQACGRIVRSDTDEGHTYILDSDFMGLWERQQSMFPKWWTDALVWPNKNRET